jgi:putative Holliday junction resolvase
MRSLGIDFGEKRIGLAVSDPAGSVATPLDTLIRKSDHEAIERISDIARREGVERLVVGEPVGLDGHRGERLREAGVDPRRHPERIDALAAQILLQQTLDRERRPGTQ